MSLQNTNLLIQGSHLPATFKGTPDDLFVAMLERMKIVSPAGTSFFVISDTMPSSNQGPWLKGGKQWWVWDEETKTYVPLDLSASETIWFQTSVVTPVTATPPVWLQIASDGNPVAWNWWNGSTWIDFTTLKDRSVTTNKLYWLANFFVVAQGVNDYTASFSLSDGFGYGDGINGSFLVLVKFPSTNTGVVTLNVNNLSPRPVKKQTNMALVAGEIVAGSVHLLAYDGANFQVLSPLQILPGTDHGIPKFLDSAVLVYNGGPVGWTVYNNLLADGVPADASAIILQTSITGGGIAKYRKISGAQEHDLADGIETNQGIYPIVTQTFGGLGFNFTLDAGVLNLLLVGYIT